MKIFFSVYQKRTLVKSAESSELAQEADNQEEINLGLIPAIYNSLRGNLKNFYLIILNGLKKATIKCFTYLNFFLQNGRCSEKRSSRRGRGRKYSNFDMFLVLLLNLLISFSAWNCFSNNYLLHYLRTILKYCYCYKRANYWKNIRKGQFPTIILTFILVISCLYNIYLKNNHYFIWLLILSFHNT